MRDKQSHYQKVGSVKAKQYLSVFSEKGGNPTIISIEDFFNSSEVDNLIESASDISNYVLKTGDTMTGDLIMSGADIDMNTNSILFGTDGLVDFGNDSFEVTTDNAGYNESWLFMNANTASFGFADRFIVSSATQFKINVAGDVLIIDATDVLFGTSDRDIQWTFEKNFRISDTPNYADDTAADADATLQSGSVYTTTAGGRTLFKKP